MTFADAASFSTALSGLAVCGSIIYLGIQTHQASKHTRALIQQGSVARVTAITIGMMPAEYCAAWIAASGGDPTPAQIGKRQFFLACATMINAMEDLFLQHSDGLLRKEHYERECETFRGLLSEPGVRAFWEGRRASIGRASPRFAAFGDSLCSREAAEFSNHV